MFSPNVVGFANALAGGWGNAGQSSHPFMHMHTVESAALFDGCWLLYIAVKSAAAESCVCASFRPACVFLLLITLLQVEESPRLSCLTWLMELASTHMPSVPGDGLSSSLGACKSFGVL